MHNCIYFVLRYRPTICFPSQETFELGVHTSADGSVSDRKMATTRRCETQSKISGPNTSFRTKNEVYVIYLYIVYYDGKGKPIHLHDIVLLAICFPVPDKTSSGFVKVLTAIGAFQTSCMPFQVRRYFQYVMILNWSTTSSTARWRPVDIWKICIM